jgi:LPS export ABC transporter protein LptC
LKTLRTYKSFIIPASALVGIIVFSCTTNIEQVERVTNFTQLPTQTIFNSSIQFTDSAIVTFKVTAGKIDRYSDKEAPHDEFNDGVEVLSYDKEGKVESTILALRAVNYPEESRMEAMDSVTLENNEGKKLETELLIWNQKENRIHTDKHVKITTATEILFGEGLDAKDDFSSYEIRNITGRIKVKENRADSTNSN